MKNADVFGENRLLREATKTGKRYLTKRLTTKSKKKSKPKPVVEV